MVFKIWFSCLLIVAALSNRVSTVEVSLNKVTSANINALFDQILPAVKRFMVNNGMEPISLPDFNTRIGTRRLAMNVNLDNGFLNNFVGLKRAKNVILYYSEKHLLLDMTLRWNELSFSYDYTIDFALLRRTGYVDGVLKNIDLNVRIAVDLQNFDITIQSIKTGRVGDIEVIFSGHLSDRVVNKVSKIVIELMRRKILRSIETKAVQITQLVVDDLQRQIKQIVKPNLRENYQLLTEDLA